MGDNTDDENQNRRLSKEVKSILLSWGTRDWKHFRLKDFNRKEKRVIAAATMCFKSYICTREPYVNGADEFKLADEAYAEMASKMKHSGCIDDEKWNTV